MSFKRFDQDDIVISAESITSPIWSGDKTTLSSFFTSSTQTGGASGDYYYDIFQTQSTAPGAKTQFSIAYADKLGRGGVSTESTWISIGKFGRSPILFRCQR